MAKRLGMEGGLWVIDKLLEQVLIIDSVFLS